MRIVILIVILLCAPAIFAQGRIDLSGLEENIITNASFQFVNQIIRPCASGATPFAKVEADPGGLLGNVDVTTCVGGSFRVNGAIIPTNSTQNANLVFAGPTSGAAALPTFRSLVTNDLPSTAVTPGAYTNANITVDAKGRLTAAANGSAGAGTVTTTGTMTVNAIVTSNATTVIKTPSATTTLDSSGGIATPGSVTTGVGGSDAGNIGIGQGAATAVAANKVQLQGAASITGWNWIPPSAAGDGVMVGANASSVVTFSFVNTTGTGSIVRVNAVPYDPAFLFTGAPSNSQTLRMVVARAFDSGSSFAGTVCSAGTAATAQADFLVKKNGSTVATLRFAAAGTTCSLVSASTTAFAAADVLTIVAPSSADATLADVSITILGALH